MHQGISEGSGAEKSRLIFQANGDLRNVSLPWVLLMADHGEGDAVLSACDSLGLGGFVLLTCTGFDWNRDLSPWAVPSVFKKGEPFAGQADALLQQLLTGLPRLFEAIGHAPEQLILAGYSLAGLFSLYAGTRCDRFSGILSASGSLWYPGWHAYAAEQPFRPSVRSVYLSVGDSEAKIRNPVMQSVEQNTRSLAELCRLQGIQTAFELNPGGHFVNAGERLAKGIAWLTEGSLSNRRLTEFADIVQFDFFA